MLVEPLFLGAEGVVGTFITNHHKLFVNFRFIIVQVLVTSLEKVHKDGNIWNKLQVKIRVDQNFTEKFVKISWREHRDASMMLAGQVVGLNWRHEAVNWLKCRENRGHYRKCKQNQSSLLKILEKHGIAKCCSGQLKRFYTMWKRVNFEIRVEKRVTQCGKESISKLELKRGLHNVEKGQFRN